MAPTCPEEVDVFTIPHSRMKELVNKYLDRLTATNFDNEVHLTSLLETLCLTFREFIAHEQIENKFIMKKLKNRLKALSIQNSAVCNCHKDNHLIAMLNLFEDGYKCTKKSDADRANYGLKLRQALEEFTRTFLPHMAEEEQVFQPLLMQHFSVEELKQIKATVLQQHFRIEPEIHQEKFVEDNVSSKSCSKNDLIEPQPFFDDLSSEIVLKIFSYLNPKDLSQTAQVSTRFNELAMDKSLWTHLFPVCWANGDWNAVEGVYYEDTENNVADKLEIKVVDEDADVDESDNLEDWDTEALDIQRQSFMLTSICKYLLPRVGLSVQHCDLAYSKGLTNGTLYKILSLCPNLEYLNLTQTRISDLGFKGLDKNGFGKKLKHLDLTGCLHITDIALERLASAFGGKKCLMTDSHHMTKDNEVNVDSGEENLMEESVHDHSEKDFTPETTDSKPEVMPESELCCQNKNKHFEGMEIKLRNIHNSDVKEEKSLPGTRTCCQKTDGCMKKHDTGRQEKNCGQDSNRIVDTDSTGDLELKNEAYNKGNFTLKRLLKCVCCGKVDEVIDGVSEEDRNATPCFQERLSNHGNQSCCHGRASTATDTRVTNCQGENMWKKYNSKVDIYNYKSNSYSNHCCQQTSAMKNQGHPYNNNSYPKAQVDVCEYEIKSENDDFSMVFDHDQDSGLEVNIPDAGTKVIKNLEQMFLLEQEILKSENPDHLEESWTLNDSNLIKTTSHRDESWTLNNSGPIQTEIPQMVIMNDHDLRFGMQNPDETGKNSVSTSPEKKQSPVRHNGLPLEFLSLSGCYQITDVGLSCLSENKGLPNLEHLDLSGCLNVTGPGVAELVNTCLRLDPSSLFYCDNILDGPYPESASGCQNLQCSTRICCRGGE